jgi:hypothetical protein
MTVAFWSANAEVDPYVHKTKCVGFGLRSHGGRLETTTAVPPITPRYHTYGQRKLLDRPVMLLDDNAADVALLDHALEYETG